MQRQDPASKAAAGANVKIRGCRPSDLSAVAKLAARLVREHHAMDPERFFIFDRIEEGYAEYLRSELDRKGSVVLVACEGRRIWGYAYGRMEPRDWNALRERCGALHDVYVDERARRKGIASLLVEGMVARLSALGAPRVVLMTATQNTGAHRLFERLGFRTTMLEMTKEC
jgi:ribosomal protein S18 acetylase RimI-like enzyme